MLRFAVIIFCAICLAGAKIINYNNLEDLSYSFDEKTQYWYPNDSFKITTNVAKEIPKFGWLAAKTFETSEHGGTHLDAPYHFNKDGWKVDDIPPCHSIAEGVHIDVKDKVNGNADFELLPEHLEQWEQANGKIPSHSVVLVNFGWASRYGNRLSYFGNESQPFKFPGVSKAAAEYIVRSGNVIGVGVDTPSVDKGASRSGDSHRTLANANIFNLENVALNGTSLPAKGFDLIILPVKIGGGTGGPVRILALY